MEAKEMVASLVEKSRIAQKQLEKFNQQQIDDIVRAIAKVVYDNAEPLSRLAVDETRMGVYEHKVAKCKGKSKIIWGNLKGKVSIGIVDRNEETGITVIARPVGVVGALHQPCRHPDVQRHVRHQGPQYRHHLAASARQETDGAARRHVQ